MSPEAKRELIEPAHAQISIARQCALVGVPRSTYYYEAQGENPENLLLMRLLDKQYTDTPYYGVRRMTAWLRSQGYPVNHKRVARLMHILYPLSRTNNRQEFVFFSYQLSAFEKYILEYRNFKV